MSEDAKLSLKVAVRPAGVIFLGVIAFQLAMAFGAPWGRTRRGQDAGVLSPPARALAIVSVLLLVKMMTSLLRGSDMGH